MYAAANIKVFGVGGGGCNAINRMIEKNLRGVTFYAVNTDAQALNASKASNRISIGTLGAGANPDVGRKAAEDHRDEIEEAIKDADMVYITCGEGGGTGTGAAPVIAKIAKSHDILTVGVVTKPFNFEGRKRKTQAEAGISELRKYTDSLIIVSNENLLKTAGNLPIMESFKEADEVLRRSVQAVTDLINIPSMINLDFADVKSTLEKMGNAIVGIGGGKGPDGILTAANNAISSPLLDFSPKGAKKGVVNIATSGNISLSDIYSAVEHIKSKTNPDMDLIFGTTVIPDLKDSVIITVILSGVEENGAVTEVKIQKPVCVFGKEKVTLAEEKNPIPAFAKPGIINDTITVERPVEIKEEVPRRNGFFGALLK